MPRQIQGNLNLTEHVRLAFLHNTLEFGGDSETKTDVLSFRSDRLKWLSRVCLCAICNIGLIFHVSVFLQSVFECKSMTLHSQSNYTNVRPCSGEH